MCNRKTIAVVLAACALSLTACGDTDISTGNEPSEDAVYTDEYISLAPYKGLTGEKKNYKITQEAIDAELHAQLEEFADYNSVDRPSQDGDWVYADYSIVIDGETYLDSYDEDGYFVIGNEEYGEEFDKKITGLSAGDELTFSLSYDKDYIDSDLAGQTADFTLKVNDIREEIMPDCTDEFIKKNLDYDTYDEFVEATTQTLRESYDAESMDDLQNDLLQQVIDNSSILKYKKKAYKEAYDSVVAGYESYAEMFGTDLSAIYDSFEITDDGLKEEAFDLLYRNMVTDAIIKQEGFSLSDEEYDEGVASYAKSYEYDTVEEFEKDYTKDDIRATLLDDKVLEFLVDNAQITEVEADYEDY